MGKFIDLTGERFGRLTVIGRSDQDYIEPNGNHRVVWRCRCDCGNIVTVTRSNLKYGRTISCGCYQKNHPPKRTHGYSKTRLYSIYHDMIRRCECKNNKSYKYYGARGIQVCSEWRNNFESFMYWSYMYGYAEDLTLDRIDINGNYEPSNCRWVDLNIQMNNRHDNHYITYNHCTMTISQWSRKYNIDHRKIYHRLVDLGWSVEKALTTK